jgi:hypothetical protein
MNPLGPRSKYDKQEERRRSMILKIEKNVVFFWTITKDRDRNEKL